MTKQRKWKKTKIGRFDVRKKKNTGWGESKDGKLPKESGPKPVRENKGGGGSKKIKF